MGWCARVRLPREGGRAISGPWAEGMVPQWRSGGCAVDLQEVEGSSGEVDFAERAADAAAGESVDDPLQVADAGLDGRYSALVLLDALGCGQSMVRDWPVLQRLTARRPR